MRHSSIMRWTCTLWIVLATATWAAAQQTETTLKLGISDASQWRFLGGDWSQGDDGLIVPPNQMHLHSRAFYIANAYDDVTVEFDYRASYRNNGMGNAGLILRAQNGGRFYWVHLPWNGQAYRAKNYWAGVGVLSGDEYVRNLKLEYVPNVPSETNRWYHVKVEAKGPRIQVWVDGRRAVDVNDDTYRSGFLGLAGYGWYQFRNVNIQGTPLPAPAWSDAGVAKAWSAASKTRVRPPAVDLPDLIGADMPTACIAPNGDVLVVCGGKMIRSRDHGRTWEPAVDVPPNLGNLSDYRDTLFTTSDGRLLLMRYRVRDTGHPDAPWIGFSESKDNGHTWLGTPESYFVQFTGKVDPTSWPAQPATLQTYGPLIQTDGGTWIRLLMGGVTPPGELHEKVQAWGAVQCRAFAVRSTDQGATWSSAIELDQPTAYNHQRGDFFGSLDMTEPTGVAIGDTVTVLVRPIYSTQMWQCWSYDQGKTWDAAVRTTFPGYAQAMIRLKSGPILVGHRHPQYSINVSYDDGVNWDAGTIIDYPGWAMGTMLEVEPDIVLAIYMSARRDWPLRAQRIRVNPNGLVPLTPGK
jgi:hypothetical protein